MDSIKKPTNLLGLDHQALRDFFISHDEKPFRATQVLKWIHGIGVTNIDEMLNLSLSLREKLKTIAIIHTPEIVLDKQSTDGTRKWLLKLDCGNCVETVFIPEKERGTLCVSSQIGCGLNCTFCATGAQGFNRDLSSAEIIGQEFVARAALAADNTDKKRHITNVVMMGMGEPLLNFNNVVCAMNIMMDDHAYNLSKYRVTLSTSGVVPAMIELSKVSKCALAISLHAPTDAIRDILVPINKKYPLKLLLDTCKQYFNPVDEKKRHITMEYVMLDGINDKPEHAIALAKLLQDIRCKVNLIPFNPFQGTQYQRSKEAAITLFQEILMKKDLICTVRRTRGGDIDGACGQLAGEFQDKTKRRINIKIKQEKLLSQKKGSDPTWI